jgi:hypothetical protein
VSLDTVYGKLHIFLCGENHGSCSQEKTTDEEEKEERTIS